MQRILENCEFEFQKHKKNEMLFGVFDGEEMVLRHDSIDFMNCELQASVKQRTPGAESELKLRLKFPNQTAIVNDGIFAVAAAYLKYRGIPEEEWEDYLLSSGEDQKSCRMTLLEYAKQRQEQGGMNYAPGSLSSFSVSVTIAGEKADPE